MAISPPSKTSGAVLGLGAPRRVCCLGHKQVDDRLDLRLRVVAHLLHDRQFIRRQRRSELIEVAVGCGEWLARAIGFLCWR